MTLIYSVILCLLFKAKSCQFQRVEEFEIIVATPIDAESGDCISIPYELTFPANKVTVPYKKIWFKGDPQIRESVSVVTSEDSNTKDTFWINGLPHGEYEYGFILEWENNQTYIFPKRVRISVSASTQKPTVRVSRMTEGQPATLRCDAPRLCSGRANIYWKGTKADGHSRVHHDYDDYFHRPRNTLRLIPTADDHNTNITCVAQYEHDVVETTVTLTVKFPPLLFVLLDMNNSILVYDIVQSSATDLYGLASFSQIITTAFKCFLSCLLFLLNFFILVPPKILSDSQCIVDGKRLVCVCISRGNPLPPISWPLAFLTDFSVTSSSSVQTVNSTITMPAADNHNTTVKCISRNELGQAEIEISLQNYTENMVPNYGLDSNHKSDAVLPWIMAGVSISLNLVLFTILIICTHKWGKSQQKELREEMNTYASLNQADVGQLYSVISPQTRKIT